MRAFEAKVPPPVLLVILGGLMWGATAVGPALLWERGRAQLVLAIVVGTCGAIVNAMGFRTLRRAGTTFDPTRPEAASTLVTHGVFRLTRNPMYVGFTLLLTAWALWLSSVPAMLGPVLYAVWVDRLQIRPEERALRSRFGSAFTAYQARVRRWI